MNSKSKPHSNKVNEASSTILNTNHIKQPNKIISKSKEISNNSNKSKDLNITTYIECDHNLIKEKRSRNDNSIYKNPNLKSVLSTYNKLSSLNNSLNTKTIKFNKVPEKEKFIDHKKHIKQVYSQLYNEKKDESSERVMNMRNKPIMCNTKNIHSNLNTLIQNNLSKAKNSKNNKLNNTHIYSITHGNEYDHQLKKTSLLNNNDIHNVSFSGFNSINEKSKSRIKNNQMLSKQIRSKSVNSPSLNISNNSCILSETTNNTNLYKINPLKEMKNKENKEIYIQINKIIKSIDDLINDNKYNKDEINIIKSSISQFFNMKLNNKNKSNTNITNNSNIFILDNKIDYRYSFNTSPTFNNEIEEKEEVKINHIPNEENNMDLEKKNDSHQNQQAKQMKFKFDIKNILKKSVLLNKTKNTLYKSTVSTENYSLKNKFSSLESKFDQLTKENEHLKSLLVEKSNQYNIVIDSINNIKNEVFHIKNNIKISSPSNHESISSIKSSNDTKEDTVNKAYYHKKNKSSFTFSSIGNSSKPLNNDENKLKVVPSFGINLENIARTNFNDEFTQNYKYFSESWRKECDRMEKK